MGDASSKDDAASGFDSPSAQTKAAAEDLQAAFANNGRDGAALVEGAFGTEAAKHIREIVREIEGLEEPSEKPKQTLPSAPEAGTRRARDDAQAWLEEQLRTAEAKARKAREAKEQALLQLQAKQQAHVEASKMARSRAAAREESEAREALRQRASAAAEARLEAAETEAQRTRIAAGGVATTGPPRPLPVLSDLATEAPPPLATLPAVPSGPKPPTPEFYKLLGIDVDATFAEVKKGYRQQALKWHPDKNRGPKENDAADRFKRISEAFDTLYDPKKRTDYDAGQLKEPQRRMKLQGHGWSTVSDEDPAALTPQGVKWKKQSWVGYIFYAGRLDDDRDNLVESDADPRAPQMKTHIFWRFLAERAYDAQDEADGDPWVHSFVQGVWKDTPEKWPSPLDLQAMNEAARLEWKERRMVFNRRKLKLMVYLDLHEEYLAIPDRKRKEKERLIRSGLVSSILKGEDGFTSGDKKYTEPSRERPRREPNRLPNR